MMTIEKCTLGGGCFWCLDPLFRRVKGVESVFCGYANGTVVDPTYEQVCTGSTGHAEVVQITYDSKIVSFEKLLEVFFSVHNPTTLNRQEADVGTQYRSAILFHNEGQERRANAVIEGLTQNMTSENLIVTEVAPLDIFYKAEVYHQGYFLNNPENGYCQMVVEPKLSKFLDSYSDLIT